MNKPLEVMLDVYQAWRRDGAVQLAAALAFYTAISLTPLIILLVSALGFFVGDEAARGQLADDLTSVMGSDAAGFIEDVIEQADQPKLATVTGAFSLLVLFWGATNVFTHLQTALDRIWGDWSRRDEDLGTAAIRRIVSLGFILGIIFILLVSLVVSTFLTTFLDSNTADLPGPDALWIALNFGISVVFVAAIFALIFKFVPQTEIQWREVWPGAVLTSLLFNIGKLILGLYLGTRESAYAAGGSILALLLWTYYSAQIVLFGAEFIRVSTSRAESVLTDEAEERVNR